MVCEKSNMSSRVRLHIGRYSKDLEDIAAYRKSIERQRVHIFLAGLDGDFEQVQGEILRKDPLPDLEIGRASCRERV